MINFDYITQEIIKEHNPNWPQIPGHPYKKLTIGGSRFGKTNALFNVIGYHLDIYKMYLYAKYPYEAKYQLLISKREGVGLDECNDSKVFV